MVVALMPLLMMMTITIVLVTMTTRATMTTTMNDESDSKEDNDDDGEDQAVADGGIEKDEDSCDAGGGVGGHREAPVFMLIVIHLSDIRNGADIENLWQTSSMNHTTQPELELAH